MSPYPEGTKGQDIGTPKCHLIGFLVGRLWLWVWIVDDLEDKYSLARAVLQESILHCAHAIQLPAPSATWPPTRY